MTRVVFATALLSACANGGRADTILALTGDDIAGESLYADHCAVCHAADGSGGSGPNLSNKVVGAGVVNTVLNGAGEMPSFRTLSDQEVADLLAWLDANVFG
jgi:mono/diheme cytochrome c family protein